MTFGEEWGVGCDESTSRELIDRYIEGGGNFLDTANIYNDGSSELIIGNHLGRQPAKRDRIVIATKFSGNMHAKDPNGGGANRKSVISACESSLRRLQTDYIDLYWLHWNDPFTPIDETLSALNSLVSSGKIRYFGFSDSFAWRVARAHALAEVRGWAPVVALQFEYSLLERTVEGELIPMALELDLAVMPWSPLRGGLLSGKYSRSNMVALSPGRTAVISRGANEHTHQVLDTLEAIARRLHAPVANVALAWVVSRPGVTSTIIGARSISQLEMNLQALELQLNKDDLAELNAATMPLLGFPHAFLSESYRASFPGNTINGQHFPSYARYEF